MTTENEIAKQARAKQDEWYRQKRAELQALVLERMKAKSTSEKEREQ